MAKLHQFCLLLQGAVAVLSWQAYAADTNSILDLAASSTLTRQQLISDYEASPETFHDERLLEVGISYGTEKRFDKAEPVYRLFLQEHPDNARAQRGMGLILLHEGHPDQAAQYLERALSLGDEDSVVQLAAIYAATEAFSEIERLLPILQQNTKRDPAVGEALIALAGSRVPPDTKLLRDGLHAIPDHEFLLSPTTAFLIEKIYPILNGMTNAQDVCEIIRKKVIRSYEANTDRWPKNQRTIVADCYYIEDNVSEARRTYEHVLQDEPDNSGALLGLGSLNLYMREFPESRKHLRLAWELGETNALRELAAVHIGMSDYDGMASLVPALLARKGEDPEFLNALLAYSIQVRPLGTNVFERAIEDVPDEEVVRRRDTTYLVLRGLELFGETERLERLRKLIAEQGKEQAP